jgi:type IV pilus assembly protein PilA
MFCYHCGATQPDNTTYCSNCGRPAKGPAQPQTPSATSAPATPGQSAGSAPGAQPSSTPSPAQSSAAPGSPWLNVPPMAQPVQPQAYRPYVGEPQTDGKATGSLILGILSLLCFSFLAGIPAVILGHMSRKNIRQSMGRLKGDGMALAGLIMGYISIASIPLVLIIAAIAIPNLLRAKISANDSAAASIMRTVNTAQVTYTTNYPAKGYARDLATLGPGPSGKCGTESETYACLLDDTVANRNERAGYRFSLTAVCDGTCTDYLSVAVPITGSTGSRTYCSTSDAVIRYKLGNETPPATPEDCQTWPPVS